MREMRDRINQDEELGVQIEADRGVVIVRVMPSTPAEAAGLQRGDLIQSVGGREILDVTDVQSQVENSGLDKPLKVEVLRAGEVEVISVTPTALPSEFQR